MNNNKLFILLSFDDDSSRNITLPSFYKNHDFSDVYVIGRYVDKINKIINLNKTPTLHKVLADPTKIFDFNKRDVESFRGDSYQAPFSKTTESFENYNPEIDTAFYFAEKDSFYDKLPFKYQLASIVKPKKLPFYVKETKIDSFSSFEEDELYYEGLDLIKIYLTAGFHVFENKQNVPGWSVSPNTSWISLLYSFYNVFPCTDDLMPYQEVISFARTRALIFYLSINEFKKRFVTDDEDDSIKIIIEKEKYFYDKLLDKNIKENILENSESVFLKWTNIELYDKIKKDFLD